MGKALIIPGADFSENALTVQFSDTPLFWDTFGYGESLDAQPVQSIPRAETSSLLVPCLKSGIVTNVQVQLTEIDPSMNVTLIKVSKDDIQSAEYFVSSATLLRESQYENKQYTIPCNIQVEEGDYVGILSVNPNDISQEYVHSKSTWLYDVFNTKNTATWPKSPNAGQVIYYD